MSETTNNAIAPEEKKKGGAILIAIIAILVVIGVSLAVVSGSKGTVPKSTTESNTPAVSDETESMVRDSSTPMASGSSVASASPDVKDATTTTPAEGVKTINLEAGSFYYKPAAFTVKKGEKIKIVMKSADMMHDFNIDELNVSIPITKSGETGTAEFTATKTGVFEYYCSVGEHREKGQVGKITVE